MYACLVTYIARCTLSPNSNPFRQRHRRAFKLVSITIRERERDYFPIFIFTGFLFMLFLLLSASFFPLICSPFFNLKNIDWLIFLLRYLYFWWYALTSLFWQPLSFLISIFICFLWWIFYEVRLDFDINSQYSI